MLKPRHAALSKEERYAVQAKQGRGVFGIDMKIVGEDGHELPHDGKASGELLVRGPWVIASYMKGEGGDPLVDGWFPTGDVANIDTDGFMQITDRAKDVIKSGGEWIGSIDLENIAMAHPGVADGRLHRGAAPEVGRAAAARGHAQAGRDGHARGAARLLRGQDRQVVDAGRRGVRRCHPARCHRQDAEEQAARAVPRHQLPSA
jgi:acyl-CoA synthetase (AMP-forming)/AMP-acid ligase II